MRPSRKHDFRSDRGSLVVELVVLTPVIFMFALAAVSFGRLSEAHQQVVESARSGAQAAAVMPSAAGAQWAASANAVVDLFDRAPPVPSRRSRPTSVSSSPAVPSG